MSLSGGLRVRGGYRGTGTDERGDVLGEGVDNRDESDIDSDPVSVGAASGSVSVDAPLGSD